MSIARRSTEPGTPRERAGLIGRLPSGLADRDCDESPPSRRPGALGGVMLVACGQVPFRLSDIRETG